MVLASLGANIPFNGSVPSATLHAAIAAVRAEVKCIPKVSGFYETAAWPNRADPPFVNAVCRFGTDLSLEDLLEKLHEIERQFGRERIARNAPRTLDIDILDFYGRVQEGQVTLPHPRMGTRGFVLIPLRDVDPDWIHPVTRRSMDEMIAALPPEARDVRRIG
ncbi:MAG: 2-amino-4-hydroxy-6-hydroxymethyldihydropteridine diphosphokinase [Rhizomicrobium sp.]